MRIRNKRRDIQPWLLILLTVWGLVLPRMAAAGGGKGEKYLVGYYIDSLGNKVDGFISMEELGYASFLFKKELGGKKVKILVTQCRSFSFENHTFCTIRNITIHTRLWQYHFDKVFAEQVGEGRLLLYRFYFKPGKIGYMKYVSLASQFAQSGVSEGAGVFLNKKYVNYFLKKSGDSTGYVYVGKKKRQFRGTLAAALQDDPPLVRKIMAGGDYSFNNIESVIGEYNRDKCRN